MKCIVTGSSGFIGSHVVTTLRRAGHEVLTVDCEKSADRQVDICDTQALVQVFQHYHPQVVFHIAAIADARKALADPVQAVNINIAGTANTFNAARLAGTERVVLASTCWVAGAMRPGVIDETEPFQPSGAGHIYTTTKIASELIAHDFFALYKLPFTILRYGIPYGPGMWSGLALRAFLDCIAEQKPITIFGDGSASRRFLYIQDLADAHVLTLQETATNQIYNLEGAEAITIRHLVEALQRFFPQTEVVYQEEPTRLGEFQYFRQVISSAKALTELRWLPKAALEDGLQKTIEWYHTTIAPLPGFVTLKA